MSTTEPELFPLAEGIHARIADDIPLIHAGVANDFIDSVTPTTAALLRWWFQDDARERRTANFHNGQRDAILAIIYAHEILESTSLKDLYDKVRREALLHNGMLGEVTSERHGYPKYAAKMATGTGKTWVLNALLIWQHLNNRADPTDPRFSSNFLIVAPGLIVYDRLLDSFLGTKGASERDFATSDIYAQRELFVPDDRRPALFSFLQTSVVTKKEIGSKVTGTGMIAITNWHLLAGVEDPDFLDDDEERILAPGEEIDVAAAIGSFFPLTPGTSTGNSLETLDRRFARGRPLDHLVGLSNLVVFNDEAHHVHQIANADETTDVEWQKSLSAIAEPKGRRFVQVDFSATPYNETGSGSKRRKKWFPHIVVDFPLFAAMRQGLVKSLALDKRTEIASLPLDFTAERDERNQIIGLSDGQRTMIRAGVKKLQILEQKFVETNEVKHPKLLIVTEDTKVSPFVEDFLRESGLSDDEFLRVDSGRKTELGPKEWEPMRERLFDIDRHSDPTVIISVLMLREGFDVNNICVIVPLRSSASGILLEQTIGRGLRLMWRGDEAIDELKLETRQRMQLHKAPTNYFDVLFVVEHPAFEGFYDDLVGTGVAVAVDDASDSTSATGDLETVELRDGYESYDFRVPAIIRDVEEELVRPSIDPLSLEVGKYPLDDLLAMIGTGDRFASHDLETGTQYGDFRVDGGVMTATGYNDYLSRITNRITEALGRTFVNTTQQYNRLSEFPILQTHKPLLLGWIDRYIRSRLFGRAFDPLDAENWRVLLLADVSKDIAGVFATALLESQQSVAVREAIVHHRLASEVSTITVRTSAAVAVTKCIYPKLRVPARGGGLERLFIEWADTDAAVEALLKIDEFRHDYLHRPYLKADGMPAQYSPDFLVRTAHEVYVVETKAQSALSDENVQRKKRAALAWCEQLNELAPEHRDDRLWHYVLLGESTARDWHSKGEQASRLLAFARLRRDNGPTDVPLFS
ncbi:DEAD/DEAH box helicase family protein [Compostimonas suwonensis]|uniref:Type III restriction enzyme n=1 Tax=Compostimonas suwonensis TaxID=1048394 RepID=A0A2M9BWM6_9MICO|nr:DEAD/DEAH box helicase family protein [Compostimonas suwonensis]PJJ62349.1 type III restriction enzyme [Compostimonas suwonensis]